MDSWAVKAKPTPRSDFNDPSEGCVSLVSSQQLTQSSCNINILLLGETGVGKSTWINGLANYLTYATLNDAKNSEPVSLIPTEFTITDKDFKKHIITYGHDRNEVFQTGQSATQMPKTYCFVNGTTNIRIIDTPGIGDTRGIEQDKKNLQFILTYLADYDDIHGIVILLKPNNSRLTLMFSFCIKEILTHLHRDACKNMMVCFTNARGTFYRPGDTLPSLEMLLAKNKDINIDLSRNTIYCIDNESIRFLMAAKSGVEFDDDEYVTYASSWQKSVTEYVRLINYIASLKPHLVKHTTSLNEVRSLILDLSRPMLKITQTINNNLAVIKDKQKEVLSANMSKDELTKRLNVPVITLKAHDIPYPQTVCTSLSCVETRSVNNVQTQVYKTICHDHCSLTIAKNTISCVALQNCTAMSRSGDRINCNKCGCVWNVHMHITYEMVEVATEEVDQSIVDLIKNKQTAVEAIEKHKKQLEDKVKQLNDVKSKILKISAIFACFLRRNAIMPFNDSLLEYLDHVIKEEEGKVSVGVSKDTLQSLQNMKNVYQEQIDILKKALEGQGALTLDSDEIHQNIADLYRLPTVGKMLQDVMAVANQANDKLCTISEKAITVKQGSMTLVDRIWVFATTTSQRFVKKPTQ